MMAHKEHTESGLKKLGHELGCGISWLGFWIFCGATVASCNYKQAVTGQESGSVQQAVEVFTKEDEGQSND